MSERRNRAAHAGDAFRRRLADVTDKLVKEFSPDKILLFGSMVSGKPRPESSVDLLIIARTEMRFVDRIKRAIKACEDVLPAVAPLVYTPEEVQLLDEQGEGFIQEVLKEGKELYSKTASRQDGK